VLPFDIICYILSFDKRVIIKRNEKEDIQIRFISPLNKKMNIYKLLLKRPFNHNGLVRLYHYSKDEIINNGYDNNVFLKQKIFLLWYGYSYDYYSSVDISDDENEEKSYHIMKTVNYMHKI
jgi:hypothetical protein